jgi:hypothetical protein
LIVIAAGADTAVIRGAVIATAVIRGAVVSVVTAAPIAAITVTISSTVFAASLATGVSALAA